jgi:phage-related protein
MAGATIKIKVSDMSNGNLRLAGPSMVISSFSINFNKEIVLQQDGLMGDLLTNYNTPEVAADLDALIMAEDPKWSKYPMNERLKKYYSQSPEEIETLRKNEVKRFKNSGVVYQTLFTPGGAVLSGMGLIKAIKGDDVNNVFTHAIKSIKNSFNHLKNNARNGFNTAIKVGQNVFNSFAEQVKASGEDIGQFVGGTVRGAQSALNARVIARQVAEAARNAMNYASNIATTVWNGVTTVYNNYVAPVVNAVSNVVSQVVQAAGNVIHQAVQAVSHAVSNVVHAIGNVVNGVVNWVKNLW